MKKLKSFLILLFFLFPSANVFANQNISSQETLTVGSHITDEEINQCNPFVPGINLTRVISSSDIHSYSLLPLETITQYSYCTCSWKLEKQIKKTLIKRIIGSDLLIADEDDVIEYSKNGRYDSSMAECVSTSEMTLLKLKQQAREVRGKKLSFGDNKQLQEVQLGLTCGLSKEQLLDEDFNFACIKDIRLVKQKNYKADPGFFGKMARFSKVQSAQTLNFILSGFGWIIGFMDFGFSSFDEFPDIYKTVSSEKPITGQWRTFFTKTYFENMFDEKTSMGLVNRLGLMLMVFFISIFVFKKMFGKESDSYFHLFTKVLLMFIVVLGFPIFYPYLGEGVDAFYKYIGEKILLSPTADLSVKMDVFEFGIVSASPYTIIGFIFNTALLVILSAVILLRNIFLEILTALLFFLGSFMIIGGMSKRDVFQGLTFSDRFLGKISMLMFYVVSIFLTVFITIILSKFSIILLLNIPSIEHGLLLGNTSISVIDNISSYGLDTFIYLAITAAIIFLGRKYILPMVFNAVEKFLKWIFFPESKLKGYQNFMKDASFGFQKIKGSMERNLDKNPLIRDKVDNISEMVGNKKDALLEKNALLKKVSTQSGGIGRAASSVLKFATGVGEQDIVSTQKQRETQKVKKVEYLNNNIGNLEERLSKLDKKDFKQKKEYEILQKRLNKRKFEKEKMVSDNASEGDLSNSDYLVDRITTLNNLKNEFDVDSRQYKDLSNQVLELSQSKIETEFNEMNEKQKKKRFNELVANKEKIMNDIDEMNEADDDYDTNMQKLDYTIKVANTELDTFTKLLNKDRKHKGGTIKSTVIAQSDKKKIKVDNIKSVDEIITEGKRILEQNLIQDTVYEDIKKDEYFQKFKDLNKKDLENFILQYEEYKDSDFKNIEIFGDNSFVQSSISSMSSDNTDSDYLRRGLEEIRRNLLRFAI